MMKSIVILALIVLVGKISLAQSDFSTCYDVLNSRLVKDTGNLDPLISEWQDCIKGKSMPNLSLRTLSGKNIETMDLKGKILVLNFWFTACMPCMAELPALNRLVKEYKDSGVVFLALSLDTKQVLEDSFFPKYKFDFEIVADAGDIIEKQVGQTGYPTTYIIDKKGNVQAAWLGGYVDVMAETAAYEKAKPVIERLLKQ